MLKPSNIIPALLFTSLLLSTSSALHTQQQPKEPGDSNPAPDTAPQEKDPDTPEAEGGQGDTHPTIPELLEAALRTVREEAQNERAEDSRQVTCDWKSERCSPEALDINGGQASTIIITNLPKESNIKITARTGFTYAKWVKELSDPKSKALMQIRDIDEKDRFPTWHERTISGSDYDTVSVDLHLKRARRDYGKPAVFLRNREKSPGSLAILVNAGESDQALITVKTPEGVKTFIIPLRYQRWFLDAAGGLLLTNAVDEELQLQTLDDGSVQVMGIRDANKLATDTAVMMHFVPANYRSIAFALGIAANTGRSPSFYLGYGWRARTLGRRALVTATLGIAAVELLEFRDVQVGDVVPASSSSLAGSERYKFRPFAGVTLGFTLGNSSSSTGNPEGPNS